MLLESAGLELGDPAWAGADHSLADELLRPSVIYTPAVPGTARRPGRRSARLCPHHRRRHRRQPAAGAARDLGAVLERSAWEEPQVFKEIKRLGWVAEDSDRVFNRGVGMALVVDPGAAGEAAQALARAGQPASVIGEVVAGAGIVFR